MNPFYKELITVISITFVGTMLSIFMDYSMVLGFFPGFGYLFFRSWKSKQSVRETIESCGRGVKRIYVVLLILVMVSFLLPSWYEAGTINTMVRIALSTINPNLFFVYAFLLTMFFSMILGSSIGTLSALGIPLISTSWALHLPVEITAGAIISGAFVGDRTSPFSSVHQLLASIIEISVKDQGKAMRKTTLLAVTGSICFYFIFDFTHIHQTSFQTQNSENLSLQTFIELLPPVLLVLLVLCRIHIITAFTTSVITAMSIACYKGTHILDLITLCWQGIDGLGGGLSHMYELIIFIAIAGAYNTLLEERNLLQPVIQRWVQTSQSQKRDTVKVIFTSFAVASIIPNQTMPIIVTGRSFLSYWSEKYSKEELARVMGDTTLFAALIPWNALALMSSTVISVSLLSYLPYAIFLWLPPILTILFTVFIEQKHQNNEKEAF